MKNNTIKFVTFSLVAAVGFLVFPVTLEQSSKDANTTAQGMVVDYEAEETSSLPGFAFL